MCTHQWREVNDVLICLKCGLTRTYDGKIMFDRKLPSYIKNKKKRKAKKK